MRKLIKKTTPNLEKEKLIVHLMTIVSLGMSVQLLIVKGKMLEKGDFK